jgi:hypothetical protein
VKVAEKRKDKKKEKKQSGEESTRPKDNVIHDLSAETLNAEGEPEKLKEKKRKKLRKTRSSSTHNGPENSQSEKHVDGPTTSKETTSQDPPLQQKTFEHLTESSNSCLKSPVVKVFSKTYFYI